MNDVTRILNAIQQGGSKSAEELLPLVYEELRRLAAHKMASEAPGHTLQPSALVHEAWLRLAGTDQRRWQNRALFFFGVVAVLGEIACVVTATVVMPAVLVLFRKSSTAELSSLPPIRS